MDYFVFFEQINVLADMVMRDKSPESSGRVVTKILKRKLEDEEDKKGERNNNSLSLPSGSKSLTVNFGKQKEQGQYTLQDCINLENSANLSSKQMKIVLNSNRVKFGRKSVEAGYDKMIPEISRTLDEFFTVGDTEAYKKKDKKVSSITKTFGHVTDLEALVNVVIDERDLDPDNVMVLFGADEGQSSIKVSLLKLYLSAAALKSFAQ